jgi:hypothetical protein
MSDNAIALLTAIRLTLPWGARDRVLYATFLLTLICDSTDQFRSVNSNLAKRAK